MKSTSKSCDCLDGVLLKVSTVIISVNKWVVPCHQSYRHDAHDQVRLMSHGQLYLSVQLSVVLYSTPDDDFVSSKVIILLHRSGGVALFFAEE
jgi:hypothetical protein